jgi:hypothetical protein
MAVRQSRCDRFAKTRFRHSGNGGYTLEGDIERMKRTFRDYADGRGIESTLDIQSLDLIDSYLCCRNANKSREYFHLGLNILIYPYAMMCLPSNSGTTCGVFLGTEP